MRRVGTVVAVFALWGPAAARAADEPIMRFATTLGNIDVKLLTNNAPLTVQNFMGYVNRGDFNGTIFHRSVSGFVIQAGGYKLNGNQAIPITAQAPVQNEPGVSNLKGTLAMAKQEGNANSATNQWFFNESDSNAANLDNQNGGFTVFGRVVEGLNVVDLIAQQQIINSSMFQGLPVVNYTSGEPVADNYIKVTSITALGDDVSGPTITISKPTEGQHFTQGETVRSIFACSDSTGVASCSAPINIDTSTVGPATFTVNARDKNNNTSSKSVGYVVDAPPPPPPSNPDGGMTTPPPTTTTPPATTPPAPAPVAPSLSGTPTTTTAGVVSLPLRCSASARCSGMARLYATVASASAAKRVVIGSRSFAVAAGARAKLTIKLNATGRKLLKKRRGRLPVTLELTPNGRNAKKSTRKLTLRAKTR